MTGNPDGNSVRNEGDDVGLTILRDVFGHLKVDPEWSAWDGRGFSWWAYTLRQRIWVTEAYESRGFLCHRLTACTDIARIASPAPPELEQRLHSPPTFSGAMVHDPADGTIRLWSSMVTHEEIAGWTGWAFSVYALCQLAEAHQYAPALADVLAGEMDESAHPTSGMRAVPDDMLSAPNDVFLAKGREASPWRATGESDVLRDFLEDNLCEVAVDDGNVGAFVPFGFDWATLQIKVDDVEPRLGSGIGMRLTLPVRGQAAMAAALANALNRAEIHTLPPFHLLGRWTIVPYKEAQWAAAFISFVPAFLHAPNVLFNLASPMLSRAAWAHEMLTSETLEEAIARQLRPSR
jgi:hypothetical protein